MFDRIIGISIILGALFAIGSAAVQVASIDAPAETTEVAALALAD